MILVAAVGLVLFAFLTLRLVAFLRDVNKINWTALFDEETW